MHLFCRFFQAKHEYKFAFELWAFDQLSPSPLVRILLARTQTRKLLLENSEYYRIPQQQQSTATCCSSHGETVSEIAMMHHHQSSSSSAATTAMAITVPEPSHNGGPSTTLELAPLNNVVVENSSLGCSYVQEYYSKLLYT